MKKIFYCIVISFFVFIWTDSLFATTADDIQKRIDNIQLMINDGIRTGQLTEQESKNLQHRLDNIKTSFEKAKEKNLPPSLVTSLNSRLDALNKDIIKEKHDPQRKASLATEKRIDIQIENLQKRIDYGSKTGQLTDGEARYLQAKLDSIKKQYENAKMHTLTTQETKVIENKLTNLNKEITEQLYDKQRKKK